MEQDKNIVTILCPEHNAYIDIDTNIINVVYYGCGMHLIEAVTEAFPDHYNPTKDFHKVPKERCMELIKKYQFCDEDWPGDPESFDVQIPLSMLDYIDNHSSFPVVIWPEIGMHFLYQTNFIEILEDLGITKGIFITNSIHMGHDRNITYFKNIGKKKE